MSGRPIGKRHQEDIRSKIQASQIINRLQSAFDGSIELTQTQVNIGKALLDKALPDLKAIEHSGPGGGDIKTVSRIEMVALDDDSTG
jgi:hypothetical protein